MLQLQRDFSDSWIIDAKRKIRTILTEDVDLNTLLSYDIPEAEEKEINAYDNPFMLQGTNKILSYLFVPTAQTMEGCYICYKVDEEADEFNKINPFAMERYVEFATFCSPAYMSTSVGANRLDLISHIIIDIFSWSNPLNCTWSLLANVEQVLTSHYIVRHIEFKSENINFKNRAMPRSKGMKNVYADPVTGLNPAMKRNTHGTEIYSDEDL